MAFLEKYQCCLSIQSFFPDKAITMTFHLKTLSKPAGDENISTRLPPALFDHLKYLLSLKCSDSDKSGNIRTRSFELNSGKQNQLLHQLEESTTDP